MKQFTLQMIFTVLIAGISLLSCNRNEYSQIADKGEWNALEESERDGWYVMHKGHIYGIDIDADTINSIFSIEDYEYLSAVDVKSFVVSSVSDYAKDDKHVYYPLELCCEDGEEGGPCYFVEYIMQGADPKTFIYLGEDYGIDKHGMYLNGERIPWDDNVIKKAKNDELKITPKPW